MSLISLARKAFHQIIHSKNFSRVKDMRKLAGKWKTTQMERSVIMDSLKTSLKLTNTALEYTNALTARDSRT